MTLRHNRILALALILFAIPAIGAGKTTKRAVEPAKSDLAQAKAKLETAVDEYKQSLQKLIEPLERDVTDKSERVAKLKLLYEASVASRLEVEEAEHKLAEAQAKVAETKKRFDEADFLLQEAAAAEQVARITIPQRGGYVATNAIISYRGSANWQLTNIASVQNYFVSHFGRSIPISAYGQTALHDRLGFDHRNAVDVAVRPDSAEGQALIAYLRSAGIPFLAFRQAIPGKATGPHVHIGLPSHRFR